MAFCIGVKIQARNEYFMNPTLPTRDEIRKNNYMRRRSQLCSEGFHSKIWKPYVDIGHPLELDKKLEVSVSLNDQEKSEVVIDETQSATETVRVIKSKNVQNPPSQRKEMEKFQQLEKAFKSEIKKSDDINFNVRVGQSFFGLMQKEKNEKMLEEAHQLKMKNDLNPPEWDTESESESEFLTVTDHDTSRPTTAVMKSRIKSRPFTPIYNNISSLPSRATSRPKSVYSGSTCLSVVNACDIDEASLYRQLCSLHWLLKAMVQDDAINMPRISLSWTVKTDKNKDNDLTSVKNRTEIKNTWDKYVFKSISSIDANQKESDCSARIRKQALILGVHRPPKSNNIILSDNSNNPDVQADADVDYMQATAAVAPSISSRPVRKLSVTAANMDSRSRLTSSRTSNKRQLFIKMRSVCDELDKDDNDYNDRKSLHMLRIGKSPLIQSRTPKSTTLMPEDHCSDKLEDIVRRNRVKSAQLIDERMAELRENVKNMSEYKQIVCSNKFRGVQTRGPFHQMLKEFRYKNDYHSFFTALDATKNKIVYANWFLSLEDFLVEYSDNKRIQDILSDIRQYALITVTKISTNRFLSVLKSLADWEIRHPEISASVKFITDHVVMMSEEDYQLWFNKTF